MVTTLCAFEYAAIHGRLECLKALVELGVDVKGVDATRVLSAAVMGNRFKCVDALLELGVPSDTLLETLGKHLQNRPDKVRIFFDSLLDLRPTLARQLASGPGLLWLNQAPGLNRKVVMSKLLIFSCYALPSSPLCCLAR